MKKLFTLRALVCMCFLGPLFSYSQGLDPKRFDDILAENLDWKPFPAFPEGARMAVVVGRPAEAGPFVVRVKLIGGTKMMPHIHEEDRIYTVISGIFYI